MVRAVVDVPVHEQTAAEVSRFIGIRRVGPSEARRELPADVLRDADILFCTMPPTNFGDLEKVQWIQLTSAGYAQVLNLGLAERGTRVTNARGCFDVPIGEWNVAMMVNLARDMRGMIRNQDAAIWDRSAVYQREIRGLRVGIWGYGGIGRETARLARLMGMHVSVLSRQGVEPSRDIYVVEGTGDRVGTMPHRVFLKGQEMEFLSSLDFLILAMPLTPTTEGLIGERELRALPKTAFVLNPARGPLIQEQALLQALREGWIAGAALDTHYRYPLPPEHPLWAMPNVILTPHISGSSLSPHFQSRIWDIFRLNVQRYINGEPLLNQLSAAQLAGA
ncbi:MAG: D-2-hydroxyacid dehydrogenase [Bryobacterales bacterium]|nr:D-2-hydroxyacid dehydrogenase [Bryobacterales bacterium]